MDGVSGAAAVIGVVAFALSSTRGVYNFVSGIQKGSKIVKPLLSNLQSLLKVLEEIKKRTDDFYSVPDLKEMVDRCAKDLESLKLELGKLYTIDANRTTKLWRNIKTTVKERDLERMSALVNQHIATLSIRIQMIEGYFVQKVKLLSLIINFDAGEEDLLTLSVSKKSNR